MADKTISIRVDETLYKFVRRRIANLDLTYKDYITKLILDDRDRDSGKTEFMAESTISREQLNKAQALLVQIQKQMFGDSEEK
nr:MAG TPA: antitoxin [Caudoviricetes sp.]